MVIIPKSYCSLALWLNWHHDHSGKVVCRTALLGVHTLTLPILVVGWCFYESHSELPLFCHLSRIPKSVHVHKSRTCSNFSSACLCCSAQAQHERFIAYGAHCTTDLHVHWGKTFWTLILQHMRQSSICMCTIALMHLGYISLHAHANMYELW